MRAEGLPRLLMAAALPVMLSGCVAAAIPAAAGAFVVNREMGDVAGIGMGKERTSGAEAPAPAAAVTIPPQATKHAVPAGSGPYAAFTRYALASAAPTQPGQANHSALIDQSTLTANPSFTECTGQPPAVVVDLDPGGKPYNLDNPPLPIAGLAENLSALRNAGIAVLWSASLPVSSAERLRNVLGATALDPDRADHLLLVRNAEERKQTRRLAAGHDWCIVAIAGDSKADFDEAFVYLRDPEGPVAQTLESYFGDGWFLAPPPID